MSRCFPEEGEEGEYNKKATRIAEWDGRGIRITIQG